MSTEPAGGRMQPQRAARDAALRVLYFCEIGRARPSEAIGAFFAEHFPDASDDVRNGAAEMVQGTVADLDTIDRLIADHSLHWRIDRLAVLDRLVLRLATWELRHRPSTPAAVVVNEALELARTYSSDASVPFVNGVLDAIRKTIEASGRTATP